MRSNLEILLEIKKAYDCLDNLKLKSGLCSVLKYLEFRDILSCVERSNIYGYLKAKYNPLGDKAYWWQIYDHESRYEAVCDCINELKNI